jgi:hypothetical protein
LARGNDVKYVDLAQAFIEKLMPLPEFIKSINVMPWHGEVEFSRQNLAFIARELEVKFRVRDEGMVPDDSKIFDIHFGSI